MKKLHEIGIKLQLMLTFMKLGVFSFGGGASMIMLLHDELVVKKKWLDEDELTEMIGISESTPGPIAINLATYLGFKKAGFLGALMATLGIVLPTFLIMFIISLFFKNLMSIKVIQYAFMGIQVAVVFLIVKVALNFTKALKHDSFAILLFLIVGILMIVFHYLNINFSAVYFILIGLLLGIIFYSLIKAKKMGKEIKK